MRRLGLVTAAAIGALICAVGCDRQTENWVSAEQDLKPPATPVRIPDLAQNQIDPSRLAAPLPGPAQGAAPAAGAAAAAPAAGEAAQIRGTIRLGEGVRAPDQGVLFVMVRKPGMRPPIAALRLQIAEFPMSFQIGPEDAIAMGGASVPFEAPLEISARIDIDGNALTRSPGELSGSAGEVAPGASGVDIVLGE